MRIIAESDRQIVETLENALICEFTVISQTGRPITHPLLPLYDADESRLYVTSSVLFSKKLDHIKKNPNVSALFSSREGLRVSPYRTVLVKGRAKIDEEDVHHGWEKLLPLWRKKEPFIDNFVKMRYALPLFWDRSIIEIDPSKLYLWPHGDIDNPPKVLEVSQLVSKDLLAKAASYSEVSLSFVDTDGYPFSIPVHVELDQASEMVKIAKPRTLPSLGDKEIALTFNHITPLPAGGYTERRYIVLWGKLVDARNEFHLKPVKGYLWDEKEVPFFQYSEMKVSRARRYLNELNEKPWLSAPWLIMRTFRLPFIIATLLPVLIGSAIAYRAGHFEWLLLVLTLSGALLMHLGANTANDYYDSRLGADDINTTPTPFSGGSRIIQYGLLPGRFVLSLASATYLTGIFIGLYLALTRGIPVLVIGLIGFLVSWGYTAPPLKLAYRGLGELGVGLGFGPILVLGTYYVQTQSFSLEALLASIPLGLLVMLILYVNEIPDRTWDDEAGKRTLVARFREGAIVKGYEITMIVVYGIILGGALARVFPISILIALLTLPLAFKEKRLISGNLGNPYGLIPAMSSNIKIFVYTAILMLAGYLVSFIL